MKLKVLLPMEVVIEENVTKVNAKAEDGCFGLLPRHIDFVTVLVPGLLSYETVAGEEKFLAIDEGVLVKCGTQVLVSTRHAVSGPDLGQLKQTAIVKFQTLDQHEKEARSALAKLEADFVRRFVELEAQNHGKPR